MADRSAPPARANEIMSNEMITTGRRAEPENANGDDTRGPAP
jgi:hypothetical protein